MYKEFKNTFSNVKKYHYIYGVSFNCNALLTYKYKILDKEIISYRKYGKFGGPKITFVNFELKLVEYCGKPYNSGFVVPKKYDGKKQVGEFGNSMIFAEKEHFLYYLGLLKNTFERNLNLINIIKNEKINCW